MILLVQRRCCVENKYTPKMNVKREAGPCCNYECCTAVVSWLPAFKHRLLDGTQTNLPACFTSLVEGIAPFCAFVKLPAGVREHTSLSTSVAEDGGFSRQRAQIWSLGGPQCITLNRLVTSVQVHFLLSVSPSQSNEMSCKKLAIIYQFIHWGCFTPLLVSCAAGTVDAWGKYLQLCSQTAIR